jgi:hypothetical protein
MPRDNPPPPTEPDEPSGAREGLRRLEERLDRASAAAERLIAEAGEHAAARFAGRRPPEAGWQAPSDPPAAGAGSGADAGAEVELLSQVLRSLRDLIPPDLEQRLAEALRELLLAVRALIDHYVERLERRRGEPVEVEDIPIL